MRVIAIDGSPSGGGRTHRVLTHMLDAVATTGASTRLMTLADREGTLDAATIDELDGQDAFIIGSPVHRASYSATLKAFLDELPRGMWGEQHSPVTSRAVALVLTGATWHHYLALNDLRNVLAGFFAAQVLSPGLYVPAEGFDDEKKLRGPYRAAAAEQAMALTELAAAVHGSPHLRAVRPQA